MTGNGAVAFDAGFDDTGIELHGIAGIDAAGFGIAYTKGEREFEFCLSFRADTAEDPDGFAEALVEAAQLLWSVVGTPAR